MSVLESFFNKQLARWETARHHYERLQFVHYRTLAERNYSIQLQCNPDRILSATAKIDAASLQQRACFLCQAHLPAEQMSLDYNATFDIRVNPFPIFDRHFTVPAKAHVPQLINGHFKDMLSLAKDFPDYTVFYNGPRSGASAPDHLHFQLVPRHAMPLEQDVKNHTKETIRPAFLWDPASPSMASPNTLTIETLPDYLRRNLILRTQDATLAHNAFEQILACIGQVTENEPEPMINLFVWYEIDTWTIVLFPRRQHRPRQYFATGEEQILFSPGCVDFAGLLILPREEDFNRLDRELLADLFGQLTLNEAQWKNLIFKLK